MGQNDTTVWEDEPMFVRDAVFQPIDTPTAVDEVARRIRQAIVLGVLRDGDRLPAETELAKRIGVGVMTVRAALSELRADGLLETHRGRLGGSFVASSDKAILSGLGSTDPTHLRQQAEVLGGLEAQAARLAAARITDEEVEILRELTAAMDSADGPSETGVINNRFHLTIAAASGNRELVSVISQRRAELYSAAFALSGVRLPLMLDGDAHPGIVGALADRDGDLASSRMWEHHRVTMVGVLDAM
ncbi:MAG: FadR/GntR family transcriptional regulator [Gaiellales bacterium]